MTSEDCPEPDALPLDEMTKLTDLSDELLVEPVIFDRPYGTPVPGGDVLDELPRPVTRAELARVLGLGLLDTKRITDSLRDTNPDLFFTSEDGKTTYWVH